MIRAFLSAAFAAILFAGPAASQTPPTATPLTPAMQADIERLKAAAAKSDLAYDLVEGLTTEVGARLAGSPAEAKARDWAVARLKALGFKNVRSEPFEVPYWERTLESAYVVSPSTQKLVIAALGNSGATPPGGLSGEIVRFPDMAALRAAAPETVRGKIAFVDEPMVRTMDGAGYGVAVTKRSACAIEGAAKGALACLIRSVGTHSHRFAHQGGTVRPGAGTLPAAALSPPDADQLARLLERGPVRVALTIAVDKRDAAPSGNVIAEVRGREKPDEIVLIGGHLDSWDQGTGALDDGAGVAIVAAAAKLIADLPRAPKRTIRVVWYGAEETGLHGGAAYAKRHADALPKHVVAAESDFGAERIYRLRTRFGQAATPHAKAMQAALAPLGIIPGDNAANGGPDIGVLREAGVPVAELSQNGLDYFDYHHTADDTLDKIDPEALRQQVAAYAVFAYLAAEGDWDLR